MRREAELAGKLTHLVVVVGRVEAEALRPLVCRFGSFYRDRLERRAGEEVVVAVGALVGDPDRNAFAFGEERPLRPLFALSVGLAPVWLPPSGALVIAPSIASHSHSIPLRSS